MRVLLTNNTLASRAGSELYLRDVALALLRRGHQPVAYSTLLGTVADELRALTVPVIDDLSQLGWTPDLIHAHHHLDAMTALLRFPRVPAVLFCHGWIPWEETPVAFPSIRRHVAIDDACHDRLISSGILADGIRTIRTFVDLERFRLRSSFEDRPRRALVLSNSAPADGSTAIIREACRRAGIEQLDLAGETSGRIADRPEDLLPQYDIVFAKGRAAHEAAATGAAVIVSDYARFGGLLTLENYESWRRLNFGLRTLTRPLDAGLIAGEINRYNAADTAFLAARLRAEAGLDSAMEQILAVYAEIEAERAALAAVDEATLARAASDYLRSLSGHFKAHHQLTNRVRTLERQLAASPAAPAPLPEIAPRAHPPSFWRRWLRRLS
jgi:hypothetical protein